MHTVIVQWNSTSECFCFASTKIDLHISAWPTPCVLNLVPSDFCMRALVTVSRHMGTIDLRLWCAWQRHYREAINCWFAVSLTHVHCHNNWQSIFCACYYKNLASGYFTKTGLVQVRPFCRIWNWRSWLQDIGKWQLAVQSLERACGLLLTGWLQTCKRECICWSRT